jgi:hypothetical protein
MTESSTAPGAAVPHFLVTEAMFNSRDWSRGPAPVYKMEEAAEVFFGMSASWLRLHLKADKDHPETWFTAGGKRMVFRRLDPDKGDSARVFTLADIEPMAWSLLSFEKITAIRYAQIVRVVEAVAVLYGLISPAGSGEDEG